MIGFRVALQRFLLTNPSPHGPPLVCVVEHEGRTRLTNTPLLLHGLFADELERLDRLAPTLWRRSETLERQATLRAASSSTVHLLNLEIHETSILEPSLSSFVQPPE